ncbi:YdaS family helix-turn-helix protein [Comamonas avium]|uniref:Helix-turn-helix domain-containing protein n=1 Tax=Comamonas avium TaxID=2762231 RepID=A0ABR8S783_9BURK|nr:YdaS family helix-turn-helix protein [Comamonas avium]MBD7959326.1 helix-turn-helix domain-containing protein [Comamonas avium]
MTLVELLIAKAAEKQGSQAALARELGVHRAQITNWKNGNDKCQPADLAAIAYLAGYSALNVLAAATLKEHEGTQKGSVLNEALGKEIQGLQCLNASGSTPLKSANGQEIQCILC